MERLERLELAALLLIEHGQTEAFFASKTARQVTRPIAQTLSVTIDACHFL